MFNNYTLQAKRPFEKVFTEWCSTDDYEVIQKKYQDHRELWISMAT